MKVKILWLIVDNQDMNIRTATKPHQITRKKLKVFCVFLCDFVANFPVRILRTLILI